MRTYLRARRGALAAGLLLGTALLAGACGDLTVPEYNNPSIDELQNNPTPALVRAAATGLLIGAQSDLTGRTGYVAMTGIVGREAYILDISDPRYITELLVGPITNTGAFGAGLWTTRYANIRMGNIILGALDKVGAGFSDAQKAAIRGFVKTMQAHDFLLVINTRDVNGAPIDVDRPLEGELAPLASKAQVFAHIETLLDEARADLQAAGGIGFPFALSSGFAGFDTPATFLKFNRALKARVNVYQGDYASALTDLQQSFLDTGASLDLGVYHTYGTGSNVRNELNSTNIFAHPSIRTDAQSNAGVLDARYRRKVRDADQRTLLDVSSDKQFTLYPTDATPLPIIRNEELILLRSEARWFTGDKVGAMADLNLVRTTSGGLAPIAQPATDAAYVTALLYERRYSLLFEGGHRWIDARRFGRLGTLPLDVANHIRIAAFQVPASECQSRNLPSPCTAQ